MKEKCRIKETKSRIDAQVTGHSEVCIDGVNYLQFPSGVTVKFNKNGTISTCK
jgi:hypothetical protein